jgi:hypothetical protein
MNIRKSKFAPRAIGLVVLFAIILGTVAPTFAQRRRRPVRRSAATQLRLYTVPANTVMRVRLNEQLSSKNARVGDRFSANLTEPVYASGGTEVIPVGSKVWGRVTTVTRAQRRKPGSISVSFNSIQLPTGRTAVINGSLSSLQADDVNSDNEGSVEGRKNDKRNAVFIGGGAAGGALIGAIAGGGKGAAIGAILGGALGTGARVYEKEQDADVKSGTEFGVVLNRSVSLPAAR